MLRYLARQILRVLRRFARHKLRVVHNPTQQVFPVLHNRRRHALRRALNRIFNVVGLRVTGARNLSKGRKTVTKSHVLDCT